MRFSISSSHSTKGLLTVIVMALLTVSSTVFAGSYANTLTATSAASATSPRAPKLSLTTSCASYGQIHALSTPSTALVNPSTDSTGSKTRHLSERSRPSNYGSAAQTLARLNSSAISTTSTFQNSRRINLKNLNRFYENAISKTAQRFSAKEHRKSFKISAKQPERSLKISMTAQLKPSFIRASSASVVGRTSDRWRRHASRQRASLPFSTGARASSAARSTARSFASERRKWQSSDSTSSNPATSHARCMNLLLVKLSQKTQLIS